MKIRALDSSDRMTPCIIDDEEITHLTVRGRSLSIHTNHKEFVLPASFQELIHCFQPLGISQTDRNAAVVHNKIKHVSEDRKIYFDPEITEQAAYVTLSVDWQRKIGYTLFRMAEENRQLREENLRLKTTHLQNYPL